MRLTNSDSHTLNALRGLDVPLSVTIPSTSAIKAEENQIALVWTLPMIIKSVAILSTALGGFIWSHLTPEQREYVVKLSETSGKFIIKALDPRRLGSVIKIANAYANKSGDDAHKAMHQILDSDAWEKIHDLVMDVRKYLGRVRNVGFEGLHFSGSYQQNLQIYPQANLQLHHFPDSLQLKMPELPISPLTIQLTNSYSAKANAEGSYMVTEPQPEKEPDDTSHTNSNPPPNDAKPPGQEELKDVNLTPGSPIKKAKNPNGSKKNGPNRPKPELVLEPKPETDTKKKIPDIAIDPRSWKAVIDSNSDEAWKRFRSKNRKKVF